MQSTLSWQFSSYEKIVETPQQWGLDPAGFRALERVRWVVTEKIHGANFCFVTDGQAVRCANRRAFLAPDDPFFGYARVLERLRERVLDVAARVRQRLDAPLLALYGELFGGAYPHPDVPPDPLCQPIQTGIYYAPGIEFCAFDLAVQQPGGTSRRYLPYDLLREVCQGAGLLVAEPLLISSYTKALDYPLGFDSTIPRLLGLPALPGPNTAEGVVAKPAEEIELAGPRGPLRPLLKRKIAAFAEDRRYSAAQPWPAAPAAPAASYGALDELRWAAFSMVTPNRLQNAISKIGPGRPRDGRHRQLLFRLLLDDVFAQLELEQPELLRQVAAPERADLRAFVQNELRALLRQSDLG